MNKKKLIIGIILAVIIYHIFALGLKLDERYYGMNLPNKLKISVSGSPNSCADNHSRDIGLMGTPKGWTVFVGGKGGTIPRLGDRLVMGVSDEKVLDLVDDIVKLYANSANNKERLGAYIDRVGFEEFSSNFDLSKYQN